MTHSLKIAQKDIFCSNNVFRIPDWVCCYENGCESCNFRANQSAKLLYTQKRKILLGASVSVTDFPLTSAEIVSSLFIPIFIYKIKILNLSCSGFLWLFIAYGYSVLGSFV